jgi:hypothetical protein
MMPRNEIRAILSPEALPAWEAGWASSSSNFGRSGAVATIEDRADCPIQVMTWRKMLKQSATASTATMQPSGFRFAVSIKCSHAGPSIRAPQANHTQPPRKA